MLAEASDYGLADCKELVDRCRDLVWRRRYVSGGLDSFLLVRDQPLMGTSFPSHLARLLFGDAKLVYDLRSRLIGERYTVGAIQEPVSGVEPPARGSLYQFIRQNGPCVVVFDDLQAFDPIAVHLLANFCEEGKLGQAEHTEVTADGCVVLACVRAQIPSVRELRRPGRYGPLLPARSRAPSDYDFMKTLQALLPEHLPERNWQRFLWRLLADLHRRYARAIETGQLDEPLLEISDPSAKVWDGPEPVPPPDERDLVPDIREAIPSEKPEKRYDVFISYRHTRNRELTKQLVAHLDGRVRIWIDEQSLEVDEDAPSVKARLIRELVLAVRASRCSIIFAVGLMPLYLPAGMSEDEALRRGLAMRSPSGLLTAWNWQLLELEQSEVVFIIDEITKQAYRRVGTYPQPRKYDTLEELWQMVDDFLRSLGLLGAKVRADPEPVPPPDERDLVPDIREAIPSEMPEKQYDVFISYRHARNRELTKQLVDHLAPRVSLWIDGQSPEVDEDAPSVKARLIRELVLAVRASRCSIILAIGLTPFNLPSGMSEDGALRRGLAMRSPSGHLTAWNWQLLELEQSDVAFIIDETTKQAYRLGGTYPQPRKYDTLEELWQMVDDFLRSLGLLRETGRASRIWRSVANLLKRFWRG